MKMKYCPNCASMSFKTAANGAEQCKKCGFAGEMKWDSVDVINALGRRLKGGNSQAQVFQKKKPSEVEDIEGLEAQNPDGENSGESKGSSARLPERKMGQGKLGQGAAELKEKMKGKGSSDWEVI